MGLDMVEVIIETEERFGIFFDEGDYPKIRTVGEFHQLVWRMVCSKRRSPGCPTTAVALRLRRALVKALDIPRHTIQMESSMAALLPRKQPRRFWKKLQSDLQLRLPELCRSKTIVAVVWLLPLLLYFVIVLSYVQEPSFSVDMFFAAICTELLGAGIFLAITQPFIGNPPRGCATFRETVVTLAEVNKNRLQPEKSITNQEDVGNEVRKIISKALDLPLNKVTPEARFVEDLGAG